MSINLSALMKQRYDTAANWTAQNPTLLAGEIGIESDTKKWKVGTGATTWTSLVYAIGGTYPIVNADIAAGAEIAVSKLADGSARQLLQTDAAGTGVEWTSDVSIPGVLSVTAGTAALPGIAVSGDPNTGIYSPGTDQLAISTNGTEKLIVKSDGKVGIGTTSPGYKLTVQSDSTNTVFSTPFNNYGLVVRNDDTTNNNYAALAFGTRNTAAADTSIAAIAALCTDHTSGSVDGELGFFTTGGNTISERARIDSSGRLLVGTSSNDSNAIAVIQGIAGNAATSGVLALRYGSTRPGAETLIGSIRFESTSNTTSSYHYAQISAISDGVSSSDTDIPGRLVFSTTGDGAASPTERLRITSGIDMVGISTEATRNSLLIYNQSTAGTAVGLFIGKYGSTAPYTGGTNSIIIWTNGNVVNTNNSYGAISDAKLKENIVDATSQWSDIKALQVRKYNFKEGQTHTQIGLVAQEVELVSPGLVTESPDRDVEGNDLGTVTKSVNYSVLYMKAVKALQEAMERIETLETRLSALEGA